MKSIPLAALSFLLPAAGWGLSPLSVAIIDERTVLKSASQRGRPTFTEKLAVSPDGNGAIDEVSYTQHPSTVSPAALTAVPATSGAAAVCRARHAPEGAAPAGLQPLPTQNRAR